MLGRESSHAILLRELRRAHGVLPFWTHGPFGRRRGTRVAESGGLDKCSRPLANRPENVRKGARVRVVGRAKDRGVAASALIRSARH
jgi:hypothetical protein